MSRRLEEFDLVWIEEPLDAYDAVGHAELARGLPSTLTCSWPRTSQWRSTGTSRPRTRARRGWSTSTGSTPCSTSAPQISGGLMHLSRRPGLSVTLTEQARAWTVDRVRVDARS